MTDDRDLITEGRAKLAAATNAPWQVDVHSHLEIGCRCLSCHDSPTVSHTTNMLFCEDIPIPEGRDQTRCEQAGYTYVDADLIVWMRNSLPALLDALEAQRARIAELERENVALRLRVEPLDSPDFEVLLKELGVDMTDPIEVLAEKVVQQRERIAELEAVQRPPLAPPTLAEIQRYLAAHGWVPKSSGSAGTMWAKDDVRLAVLDVLDEQTAVGVLDRIARAERRDVEAVLAEIREVPGCAT